MGNRGPIRPFFVEVARLILKLYFRVVHRVTVEGMENVPVHFDKLIVVANHASLLDGPLIWSFLNLSLKIIVDRKWTQKPVLKPFLQNEYIIPIDSTGPYSLKGVIAEVNRGTPLLIFPEGQRTRTGSLMKIEEGAGFVAYKTGAGILPVYLSNMYETVFSKKKGRRRVFVAVRLTIGKVRAPIQVDHLVPRLQRKARVDIIYKVLCDMYVEVKNRPSTLRREFIRSCREHGNKLLYRDATGSTVSYRKALTGSFALGQYLSACGDTHVGIFLPNLIATALVFMGLQLFRKVPVFLNYSSGPAAVRHAMDMAELTVIVTSRQFLERIRFNISLFEGRKLVYIEDLKQEIRLEGKILALWRSAFPGAFSAVEPDEHKHTAVVLFTSGSEGTPKGVCLSHENIISNIYQALSKVDINGQDYFLNPLPIFHSFGLTVGTILPVFVGAMSFLYVSPLHYRLIPEIAYEQRCTILLGTNTFLNGYGERAHPYDFHTMRYIFCGAEALSDTVFQTYAKTYGIRVMSGYGATECSPVISINCALDHEYGTVGKILPGIDYRLTPVEGIDGKEGRVGKLWVKGKNVMVGYLKDHAANRKYLVEDQGWYDTGDIVEMTESGFVKIVGRLKRFSKVSGEMISLTAIEEALAGEVGERQLVAVVGVPEERKGEKLIVVTNSEELDMGRVRTSVKSRGLSELAVPRAIIYIKDIPRLGTGKVDYLKLKEILQEKRGGG
jgi:acyl-[acyl-carrier-protein]-phospholipid O-acyltransferase / long-chain-fatty-acid--[acyl-carrier-protein] ligase